LLGNWATHCGNIKYTEQRRFEYDDLNLISNFVPEFNAVCDAVPDLSCSMQINWDTLEIPNFDFYLEQVQQRVKSL